MKMVCSNDFANVRTLGIRLAGHDAAMQLKGDAQTEALAKIYTSSGGNPLHIHKGARFEIAPGVDDVKDLNAEDGTKVLALVNANKAVLDVPNCAKAIAKIDAEVLAAGKVKARRASATSDVNPRDLLEAVALLKAQAAAMVAPKPVPA